MESQFKYNSTRLNRTNNEKKTDSSKGYDIITNQPRLTAVKSSNTYSNKEDKNMNSTRSLCSLGNNNNTRMNTNSRFSTNSNSITNNVNINKTPRNNLNIGTGSNYNYSNTNSTYLESLKNESQKLNSSNIEDYKNNRDSELFTNYSLYNKKEKENLADLNSRNNERYNKSYKERIITPKITENDNNNKSAQLLSLKQTGLDNLGNTCYMNTSLQILLHCEPFLRRLFLSIDQLSSLSSSNIAKVFYELCLEIIQNSSSSISPTNFKKVFGSSHRIFSGYSQHDTQEFLRVLLEDISNDLNRVTTIPNYRELDTKTNDKVKLNQDFDKLFKSREDSIVTDTFYGQIVNIFTCVDCNHETYSFEKCLDIPLLLENESYSGFSTFELLDEYFKDDKFKWDSPCEKCKKKSFHHKKIKMSDTPEILILSFQRYNNRLKRKNSSKIQFEEKLNISNYVDKECIGNRSCRYNLMAISNHSGSLDFGHYYA